LIFVFFSGNITVISENNNSEFIILRSLLAMEQLAVNHPRKIGSAWIDLMKSPTKVKTESCCC